MYGFVRLGCASPKIILGNLTENRRQINQSLQKAYEKKIQVLLFPKDVLTGYSLGDMKKQELILRACERELREISKLPLLSFIGFPYAYQGRVLSLYGAFYQGEIIALVTEEVIEDRVVFLGREIPISNEISFQMEDSKALIGFSQEAIQLISDQKPMSWTSDIENKIQYAYWSRKRILAITSPGLGESTTDFVYSGHLSIYKEGELLVEGKDLIFADVDSQSVKSKAACLVLKIPKEEKEEKRLPLFHSGIKKHPFVPKDEKQLERALKILSQGLASRLDHIGEDKIYLGLSGGLDSSLAMLIAIRALKSLNLPLKNLHCLSLPAYGSSLQTKRNILALMAEFPVTFQQLDMKESLETHLNLLGISKEDHSLAFENAQARERTQIIMDLCNKNGGLMIGPSDLSELALGFTTYNGDHMSMYGINSGVSKTMAQALVAYEAKRLGSKALKDVLVTPISPELLPGKDGKIEQKTEELLGPYELHDFFLYYFLHYHFEPGKILFLASQVFDEYSRQEILSVMEIFFRRFFFSQFKRSALPDGPNVTGISLSPRCGLSMPSDLSSKLWLERIQKLREEV